MEVKIETNGNSLYKNEIAQLANIQSFFNRSLRHFQNQERSPRIRYGFIRLNFTLVYWFTDCIK